MIFDTHAHYDDEAFNEDRDNLIRTLEKEGICRVVNVASGMSSCLSSIELARDYPFFYAAVGVHPAEIDELTESDMKLIQGYCDLEKVVAIGEIGLDYHYPDINIEEQKEFFVRQMTIARAKKRPVIIHSRDAAVDTMDIMRAEHAGDVGGVIHCYSYSYEMAKEYVNMGFYIGIGGVVTFKNAKKLKECAEKLPLESIVIETDCPYLAPEPNRGSRNSSINLKYVVNTIASIRGITAEEVEEQTWKNACRLYNLD